MARLSPHPRLVLLTERFSDETAAINLRGFIAPSAKGTVRLSPSPSSLSEYIEIPEKALLHSEQDEDGATELFIEPTALVSVVSVQKLPLQSALRLRDGGPDAGPEKSCLEKRIEKCKSDPTVGNKTFCDSAEGKRVFQLLCDLFGDPKFRFGGGGVFV